MSRCPHLHPLQKMEVSNKNQQPTTTLFVVNFDVRKTREVDIERHFDR